MSNPRWMQAPVESGDEKQAEASTAPRWAQAEVVDEGGPKKPLTREEKQMLAMYGPKPSPGMDRVATFTDNMLNSATFGQSANINTALSRMGVGGAGMSGESPEVMKRLEQKRRSELSAANPLSAAAGDLVGYAAPGLAVYSGIEKGARMLPGASKLINAVGKSGRLPSYGGRLLGATGIAATDMGVWGGTVGASNQADARGESPSLALRGQEAANMATMSMSPNDIPGVNLGGVGDVKVPMAALPVLGSAVERGLKGVQSAGKTITPDRVAGEILDKTGRAPSANSAAREMAGVFDGQRVSGSSIKTFRFIENALRDAGANDPDRIRRGFENIKKALPTSADGRTPLAVMIEREFSDDLGPTVAENLRKFLLKVGLDDPGVTRGFIDDLRQTQVDDFRELVDSNLGRQSATEFEENIQKGIQKKSEGRRAVLDKARKEHNDSPLAESLREHLTGNDQKGLLQASALERGWKDVDTFIKNDPWNAANDLQKALQPLRKKAFDAGNVTDYGKADETIAYIQDFLGRSDTTGLPGYNRFNAQIAAESRVRDNLGHTDGFGNTHPGFGPDLKKAAKSERATEGMVKRYEGKTPLDQSAMERLPTKSARDLHLERSQAAARTSTGEVLKDQLRGARPGGVNAQGQDVVGLRLSDLQNVGMMDAMRRVFGEKGEAIADGINSLVNRRQFLADIDPKTGSNTANKQTAMATGDEPFTGGLGRSMPDSSMGQNALVDTLLLANGIPPVRTLLAKSPGWIKAAFAPGKKQRAEIANTLLNTPQPRGNVAPPPGPVAPMSGHSNPRWRGDDRWNSSVLKNDVGTTAAGGVLGGAIGYAPGANADGGNALALNRASERVHELEASAIPGLEADLNSLEDPNVPAVEIQRLLERRGYDLGPTGADGVIGPETRKAIAQNRDAIKEELTIARSELTTARERMSQLEAQAAFDATRASPGQEAMRELSPWLGAAAGIGIGALSRGRGVKHSAATARKHADEANKLLSSGPISKSTTGPRGLNTRAANINEFWRKGGAGENVPFKTNQQGNWGPRPKPAEPSNLYPPGPERFRATDVGVMGAGLSEAGLATIGVNSAEKEIAAAQAAVDQDPSEANLARLERARDVYALAQTAQRLGLAVAAGRAAGAFKKPYQSARPDIASAEAERAILLSTMKKRK